MNRRPLYALAVGVAVVGGDQATKLAVADSIRPGAEERLTPFLSLVHTTNQGIAFGLDPGSVGVAVGIALALIAFSLFLLRGSSRWLWLPSGLILGGSLGNIVDRLRTGAVTDFIKLPLGWPPFNVADAAITVGVAALVLITVGGGRAAAPAQARRPTRPNLR